MAADVRIKELVCDYLGSLQKAGCLTLPVDEEASGILRAWWKAMKSGVTLPPVQQVAPPTAAPENPPPPAAAARVEPTPTAAPAAPAEKGPGVNEELRRTIDMLHRAMDGGEIEEGQQGEEDERLYFRSGGNSPQEAWEQAPLLLARWAPLRELGTLRETVVWGTGSLSAPVMFVGDAPNYYDEREKRPFCGEAGAKLDGVLKAMELSREQVYLTHFVKFRPMVPHQTINNRPPSRDELRRSLPVLEFELGIVRPRVIVALGVTAARGLLQLEDLPLAACREVQGAAFCGVPVVVTHHPGYLLRTTSMAERRALWEDMLRAMELAGLPITAKQRSYFLPKS